MSTDARQGVIESGGLDPTTLLILQCVLMAADGVGIFSSFTLAQYYKPKNHGEIKALWPLYVYFLANAVIFAGLVVSDAMVIAKIPGWATVPIVRGLWFRVLLAVAQLWVIRKHYIR